MSSNQNISCRHQELKSSTKQQIIYSLWEERIILTKYVELSLLSCYEFEKTENMYYLSLEFQYKSMSILFIFSL